MRIVNWIITAFILLMWEGCKNKSYNESEVPPTVKIGEAMEKKEGILLSKITKKNIEYIALESKKECLLDNNPRFYIDENEIIAVTRQQIFVFDIKTGNFLREIGHHGKDPGGYQKTVYSYPYDENRNLLYIEDWEPQIYLRYNSGGNLVNKIKAYSEQMEIDLQSSVIGEVVTSIAPLNDTCFVGHVWNLNGMQKTKLIVFNENNHRIKTYPQYKSFEWDIKRGLTQFNWDGWFYEYKNELNYFERFTDTLYSVSLENLKPRYILEGSNFIESIYETEKFLLFNLRSEDGLINGIFDKKSNETKIARKPEGLENDVDNFVPFFLSSANKEGKVVGFQQSYIIEAWFKHNSESKRVLPEKLKKLKNVRENDNPVIMITEFKK